MIVFYFKLKSLRSNPHAAVKEPLTFEKDLWREDLNGGISVA
jgi:hypothetical protein